MTIIQQTWTVLHADMQQLTIALSFPPVCIPLLGGKFREKPGQSSNEQNTIDFFWIMDRCVAIYH